MDTRFALLGITSFREEIRKSRFVATAGPVADEAAAKAFIADRSDPAANHNCWAWRCGQAYRFNDDGEPSGTAGKPILAAIDGQALDRVAVVVTRWFGGVLLGSGGLMRAYGGSAAACLRMAEKTAFVETVSATISCGFGDLARIHARLGARPGVESCEQSFTHSGPALLITVAASRRDEVEKLAMDLSRGAAVIRWNG